MRMVSRTRPGAAPLRRMLSLARPELRSLLLGTLCLAIGTGLGLLFPQVIRIIVDDAAGTQKSPFTPEKVAAGLFVLFLVQAVSVAARYVLFSMAGERVVARLRTSLFQSLMQQEVAFFDERKTGELTSRLASDTTVLQDTVSVNISTGLRFIASAVGGLGFLLYTSPVLTLVMLSVVPPVALGVVAFGRRVQKLSGDAQDALARGGEVAEEALAGIRTVRAFTAEEAEIKRYGSAMVRSLDLAKKRVDVTAILGGIASFAAYAAAALVLWYGGHLVSKGSLTVGELTSFLVYTLLVAFSLSGFSELWGELSKASGAATRVFELLDREPRIPISGGETRAPSEGKVELKDVGFSYPTRPDVPVLHGIFLTMRPGEVVALVGSSGAGKSTIAALLMRLYDPDRGEILLDGRPLRDLDPEWLRRQIGIVSQEPLLFSSSIAENIRYGRAGATDEELHAAARCANAHDFIMRLPKGYETLVGERGVQLSGGQKQRVAIARAVLKDPRLLVLDEATSALDAESEHLVKEALDRLRRGRTTLIIAHRLSTVKDADRVLVMDGGRIVQSGEHAALMRQDGLYR
ncbi:MAG TPA: ABC transporter transmembrane domain-containing protein, partial [Polyangiaceae bacterium]|nr:ABC transporter transmembrane domain-containing protein [Polyangiaceae bacterium]